MFSWEVGGAGKSTIIESLRHVLGLQPVGEEAGKIHECRGADPPTLRGSVDAPDATPTGC